MAGFSEDDLAAAEGGAHRERVRIAAAACASPQMRVALEEIAGGDAEEQAVAEALAAAATRQGAATPRAVPG